jgi:YVTN family beta-propeller protein
MRTGRLLGFGALFIAAALMGCAAGGRGSSGFDVSAEKSTEESTINQALNIQLCVDFEGLTICPAAGTSAPTGATPTPGGAPSLETPLGHAASIDCFQTTPGGPCTVTIRFVPRGFAPGAIFRALSRVGGASNPWVLGSDPVPDRTSEPLSFASALVLASPQGGPPETVQLAILAFAGPPPSSSTEVEQLHDTAATFAFVTRLLAVKGVNPNAPPTPTATPTNSPTPAGTPGANDCCQCRSSCAAVVNGACDGGCTVVLDASCLGERLCTGATPTPTAAPTAVPTAVCLECVYLSNSDGPMSVIDPGTNRVIATIFISGVPAGVALAPGGARAYVVTGDGAVAVVDTGSKSVTGTIALGGSPFAIALDPNGAFAYVTDRGGNIDGDPLRGSVSTIDIATNAVVGPSIAVDYDPVSIAVTPDGASIYVVNSCGADPTVCTDVLRGTVSIIDAASNLVARTVRVGYRPWGIRISPDGMFAYVANQCGEDPSCESEGTVSVISTITQTVVGRIHIGRRADHSAQFTAQFVAVTPDSRFAYVANTCGSDPCRNGSVSVIDLLTQAVVGVPIAVGQAPSGIAITPDGAFAYVANQVSNTVSVINVGTNKVDATIPVGYSPRFIAIVGER